MENSVRQTSRLHPLLTAAAISVTVFSAVGVGAMTGLLPHSLGSAKDAAPAQIVGEAPASTAAAPVVEPRPADMPPAAPKATPAPKKKVVVKTTSPAQDFGESPRIAQSPIAPPAMEAPKPLPAGVLGVVESVREVTAPAEKSNGSGPIVGGIAGAVLGSQLGKGFGDKSTRNIMTVLGAAGGAFGGKAIEQHARATKHWEVDVRLDDGTHRTVSSAAQPYWQPGYRVRFLDGRLEPA